MKEIYERQAEFIDSRFPDHTEEGMLNKLKEEVRELEERKTMDGKLCELTDVVLVCFAMFDHYGADYNCVIDHLFKKIHINEDRKWQKMPDGTYQHIKE